MSDVAMDGTAAREAATRDANDARLCGCLLALAERAGLPVDPAALEGASGVRATVRAAKRAGLPVRRRRLSWPALAAAAPGVVTFSDGSSLILTGLEERDGASVVLLDAPGGLPRPGVVDRRRFEAAWTGEVLVLRAARPRDGWRLGRRSLLLLLRGESALLRDLCGATAGLALLALVPFLFVQLALGRLLPHGSGQTVALLSAGLALAFLAEAALQALAGFCAARLGARLQARVSTAVVDRLLALPPDSVEAVPAGELRQRLRAFHATHRTLLAAAPRALLDAALVLAALPLLLVLDWPVALVAVAGLGLGAVASVEALQRMRRTAAAQAEAEGRRGAFLLRTVADARAVKALSLGSERLARWDALAAETGAAQAHGASLVDRVASLAVAAERCVVLGALGLGTLVPAVTGGSAPVPALLAATLLVQRLAAPLSRLPELLGTLAEAGVARSALAALLNRPREPAGLAAELSGAVAFERVTARYPGAARPSLAEVSFAVEPGTFLGVFGPSGAGKTTLGRLLARAVSPEAGAVRLDGRDTRGLDAAGLRRQVVVVSATDAIFAGTVRDMITARRADATFEEMTAAARLAGADEFIDRLPRGYETALAWGAPTLSAGQRQRLALARALLARPAILVLDEALSALDLELEDAVVGRLRGARLGLTTVLISHRLTSLAVTDAVLVLDEGRLVDHGAPADLADRCELVRAAADREGAPFAEPPERHERVLALR